MKGVDSVAVIGASAAGLSAVEALRAEGYAGPIRLVGAEPHLPYDRPPLSKQILGGTWDQLRISLRSKEQFERLEVEFLPGRKAVGIDFNARLISFKDANPLP